MSVQCAGCAAFNGSPARSDWTRSDKLNLKLEAIKVNGDEAEARGRREDVVVTSDGETVKTPGDFRFRFKRSNNRWTIEAVR